MDTRLYFGVLFGVLLMDLTKSSYIQLESNITDIRPVLTKKLQIRCVVLRDADVKNPLHKLITADRTKESVDNSSHADLYRLLSIVITIGDGDNVASVTGCDTPIVEKAFATKIQAGGSCDSSPGDVEQGYLLLTLDRPLARHAGTYTCEASALDSHKNPVSIKTSLKINAIEPTLADAVEYIATNDKRVADLEEQVARLSGESQTTKEQQTSTGAKVDNLEDRLNNSIKGQNIQTGNATCQRQTINFVKPYVVPPKVFVSFQSVTSNSNYFTNLYVTVETVEAESFTVNCVPGTYITAAFQWLAIDS